MRSIDADALKEAIRKTWLPLNREWLIMTLDELINDAPTVTDRTEEVMKYNIKITRSEEVLRDINGINEEVVCVYARGVCGLVDNSDIPVNIEISKGGTE